MKKIKILPNRGGATTSKSKRSIILTTISRLFSRRGAIIIEFAFSIPVFMALIYYLHDVPKLQRYQQQMDFVAQQVAQMLQNVSQQRTNKRITQNDIVNVARAAYLTVFPGVSMVPIRNEWLPLGFYIEFYLFGVRGEPNNKASVKWVVKLYFTQESGVSGSSVINSCVVHNKQHVHPSEICSSLTIKDGEIKIIVECHLRYGLAYHFSDGRRCKDVSFREVFGFLVYNPVPDKSDRVNSKDFASFFISHAIFAPAAGLFDDTSP